MQPQLFKGGLKHFLSYSKGERNGTIILSVILLVLIVAPTLFREVIFTGSVSNGETYERVDSFFNSLQYVEPEKGYVDKHFAISEELPTGNEAKPFFFDPNTVSIDSLVDLGLSPRQAQVVVNYRSKGGRFYSAADLSKIYGIDSVTFNRLRPWVQISAVVSLSDSTTAKIAEKLYIELNVADTFLLTKLRGIGRTFARRIIVYRDLLGGFYSTDQLSEVYGLKPDLLEAIKPYVWVDSAAIKRVNLNLVSYEELKNHPYLTSYQVKAIIYYRSKRGTIASTDELLHNKILPADKYEKIKPYLTVK
ncbi:MAG: ComEA family DNA-binding protein [Bacteroidales bacterium]